MRTVRRHPLRLSVVCLLGMMVFWLSLAKAVQGVCCAPPEEPALVAVDACCHPDQRSPEQPPIRDNELAPCCEPTADLFSSQSIPIAARLLHPAWVDVALPGYATFECGLTLENSASEFHDRPPDPPCRRRHLMLGVLRC